MRKGILAPLLLLVACVSASAQYFAIPWSKIGGGGGAMNRAFGFENGSAPNEADARQQPLEHARLRVQAEMAGRVGDQDIGATGHGHQGERTDSHGVCLFFPVPSDGKREQIGDQQLEAVAQHLVVPVDRKGHKCVYTTKHAWG